MDSINQFVKKIQYVLEVIIFLTLVKIYKLLKPNQAFSVDYVCLFYFCFSSLFFFGFISGKHHAQLSYFPTDACKLC